MESIPIHWQGGLAKQVRSFIPKQKNERNNMDNVSRFPQKAVATVGLGFGLAVTAYAGYDDDPDCLFCKADCADVLAKDYSHCYLNNPPGPLMDVCMDIADLDNEECLDYCSPLCGC